MCNNNNYVAHRYFCKYVLENGKSNNVYICQKMKEHGCTSYKNFFWIFMYYMLRCSYYNNYSALLKLNSACLSMCVFICVCVYLCVCLSMCVFIYVCV